MPRTLGETGPLGTPANSFTSTPVATTGAGTLRPAVECGLAHQIGCALTRGLSFGGCSSGVPRVSFLVGTRAARQPTSLVVPEPSRKAVSLLVATLRRRKGIAKPTKPAATIPEPKQLSKPPLKCCTGIGPFDPCYQRDKSCCVHDNANDAIVRRLGKGPDVVGGLKLDDCVVEELKQRTCQVQVVSEREWISPKW